LPVRWTIAQALVALAREVDPELCRALAAAGEDLQRNIAGPSMLDWLPSWRLVERRRALLVELVGRLQAPRHPCTWRLIWLPDDPTQGAEPFTDDQIAELVLGSFDIEQSDVISAGGATGRGSKCGIDARFARPLIL